LSDKAFPFDFLRICGVRHRFLHYGKTEKPEGAPPQLTFTARTCIFVHVGKMYDIEMCKEALIHRGWEQKDVAARTELSESAVSKFFRGETVRNSTAAAIIRALGLKVKDVRVSSGNGTRDFAGVRK
jgi:DNA-binding Xre family transcriptional regulator